MPNIRWEQKRGYVDRIERLELDLRVANALCDAQTKRIAELESQIADAATAYRVALAGACPDEQHCTCVPHLQRRIQELELKLAESRPQLNEGDLTPEQWAGMKKDIYG